MPINNLQKEPQGSVRRKIDPADESQRLDQRLQSVIHLKKKKESCNLSELDVIFSGGLKQNT